MTQKIHSISKKFISLFTIAILVCSLLIGGIGIVLLHQSLTNRGEKELELICENCQVELNALFQRIEQSVLIMAETATDSMGSFNTLVDDELREEYTENMRIQILTASNYTDGCIAAYLRYNPDYTPPTSGVFMQRRSLGSDMEQITPTDFSQYNPDDDEHVGWYYQPIRKGHSIWMDPYYNKNLDIYMISYVVPLSMDKLITGVIGMDIDFDYISDMVDEIEAYETGRAFLINEDNEIVWHEDYAYGTPFEYDESMEYESASLINGMTLILEVPRSEIFAERNKMIIYVVSISVLLLIALIFVVIKVCRSIVKPLNELTEKANHLNSGNMDIDFKIKSSDEVGILSKALDETVVRLKHYIDMTNGLAFVDSLTGIKNKTSYDSYVDTLDKEIAQRVNDPFALVMCDVNGLKYINDNFGHEFGNVLIINGCRLICKSFAHSPVFRIGGDEFVAVLRGPDYLDRRILLRDFEDKMSESSDSAYQYEQISIAFGMSEFNPDTDKCVDDVFQRADMNMYDKKKNMKDVRI